MISKSILILCVAIIAISCSKQKSNETQLIKDKWTIKSPRVIHQKGESANLKEKQLVLSSHFDFKSLSDQSDYTISVNSNCFDETEEKFIETFNFKNQNRLKIRDIIPNLFLRKPRTSSKPINCSFEFISQNQEGSTSILKSYDYAILDLHNFKDFDFKNELGQNLFSNNHSILSPREIERLRLPDLPKSQGKLTLFCNEHSETESFNRLNTALIASIFHRIKGQDRLQYCKLIAKTKDNGYLYSKTFSLKRKLKNSLKLLDEWKLKKTKDLVTIEYNLTTLDNNKDIHIFLEGEALKSLELSVAGVVPGEPIVKKMGPTQPSSISLIADNKELKDLEKIHFTSSLKITWRFNNNCELTKFDNSVKNRPEQIGYFLDSLPIIIYQSVDSSGIFDASTDLRDKFNTLGSLVNNGLPLKEGHNYFFKNYSVSTVDTIYSTGLNLEIYNLCN